MERDLEQVRAHRTGLDEQQRIFGQQIEELESQASRLGITPEERLGLEAARNELAATGIGHVQVEQEAAAQREAELTARLRQERARWEQIVHAAGAMGSGPPRPEGR
jgi:hypothetical protein